MKQTERLLGYLREHRTINPLEAWGYLGIYRLAARIRDLRRAGHGIRRELVPVENRFGEVCRVARYTLESEAGDKENDHEQV